MKAQYREYSQNFCNIYIDNKYTSWGEHLII